MALSVADDETYSGSEVQVTEDCDGWLEGGSTRSPVEPHIALVHLWG